MEDTEKSHSSLIYTDQCHVDWHPTHIVLHLPELVLSKESIFLNTLVISVLWHLNMEVELV